MAEIQYTRYARAHESTVVTDDFLRRLLASFSDAGWVFSSAEVETKDGRKIDCEKLDELLQLDSTVWRKAKELIVRAELVGDGTRRTSYASVSFEKFPWYGYGHPLTVHIHGRSEGPALMLEARLKDFVAENSEWYGFLSRGLWWWILFVGSGNVDLLAKLGSRLLGARALEVGWLPWLCQAFSAAMIWGGRQYLFPATTFAIGESAANREALLKIHRRMAKAAGFLIATIVAALIYKWVK